MRGRLRSSLSHDPFTGVFDIVYKLWVKATSMNPRGIEKMTRNSIGLMSVGFIH